MSVIFVDAPGTLSWSAAFEFANSRGARLPTKDEVKEAIKKNDKAPLFDKDIWVPVIDSKDSWVSVGNFDPENRLGKTHKKACGCKPEWSEGSDFHEFRTKIALSYTRVVLVPVDGTLTYSAAKARAEALGGRLATKAELRAFLKNNKDQPIVEKDLWVPLHDKENGWLSIGNCEPESRLGNTHEKLFGAPAWNDDSAHHAFRSHIGVVFETQFAASKLRFVSAPGTLGWNAASEYAAAHGSRLPTAAEITAAVQANFGKPLFDKDVWVPASDAADTWVSVGNCEPSLRLGKTHTELFGAPEWSNSADHHEFRTYIALVPLSSIVFVTTPGTNGYSAARDFAASLGGRLPSVAEAKAAIVANDNKPLFDTDIWIPASDAADTWVSVGNFDPSARLGKTHTELFGVPTWNEDSSDHSFRTRIGVVF